MEEVQDPRSGAEVLESLKAQAMKKRALLDEDQPITLDDLTEEDLKQWKYTATGKLIAPGQVEDAEVVEQLKRQWRLDGEVMIKPLTTGLFIFKFEEADEIEMVLSEGPWIVKHYLMLVKRWIQTYTLQDYEFHLQPFWVRILGLPLERLREAEVRKIARTLGVVYKVDTYIKKDGSEPYMRAKVMLQIRKP